MHNEQRNTVKFIAVFTQATGQRFLTISGNIRGYRHVSICANGCYKTL